MESKLTSSMYPEAWDGWKVHVRRGGGLFDSKETFLEVIRECWEHFLKHSEAIQKMSLNPVPNMTLMFSQGFFDQEFAEDWLSHLKASLPVAISSTHLPWSVSGPSEDDSVHPENLRDFAFILSTPKVRNLVCSFFLDQSHLGHVSLGQVALEHDQRELKVHRTFGFTKSSDIYKVIKQAFHETSFPKEAKEDVKYMGWVFDFQSHQRKEQIRIYNIPEMGQLAGGDFLLEESGLVSLEQPIPFYRFYRSHGEQDLSTLWCVLHDEGEDVKPSSLQELVLYHHASKNEDANDFVEFHAEVRGKECKGKQFQLVGRDGFSLRLELQEQVGEITVYTARCESSELPELPLEFEVHGENIWGLTFEEPQVTVSEVFETISASFDAMNVLSKSKIFGDWKIEVHLDELASDFEIELNDWFCWLIFNPTTKVRLSLASVAGNKLTFRYFAKLIKRKVAEEVLSACTNLSLVIEQIHRYPSTHGSGQRLSVCGNVDEQPLVRFQIVDYDGEILPLAPEQKFYLPNQSHWLLDEQKYQLVEGIRTQDAQGQDVLSDVLLLSANDMTSVVITPVDGHLLRVEGKKPNLSNTAEVYRVKACWISNHDGLHLVSEPGERNPEGGPVLAMGFGCGPSQEMAQLKNVDGTLHAFRYRSHVPVCVNDEELQLENHIQSHGFKLCQHQSSFVMQVGNVLLYGKKISQESGAIELSLVGYRRERSHTVSKFLLGTEKKERIAENDVSITRTSSRSYEFEVATTTSHEQWLDGLLIENLQTRSVESLEFGRVYLVDEAEVCFRKYDQAGKQTLFVDCRTYFGRWHVYLSSKHGRLGFFSEGSAFFTGDSSAAVTFPSKEERFLPDERKIPPHTLLVGEDISHADMLLPKPFSQQKPVWFGLKQLGEDIILLPCSSQYQTVGRLEIESGRATFLGLEQEHKPRKLTFNGEGKSHFFVGSFLFEVSKNKEDLAAEPGASICLSIRGCLFHESNELQVGGTNHHQLFSLFRAGYPLQTSFKVFAKNTEGLFRGDAFAALLPQQEQEGLLEQFQHKIQALRVDIPKQKSFLVQLDKQFGGRKHLSSDWKENIPKLFDFQVTPEKALVENSLLSVGGRDYRYKKRTREEGLPFLDRAPAKLLFEQPPTISFQVGDGKEAFHFQERSYQKLICGRSKEDMTEERSNLCVTELGDGSLHLGLFGYAPSSAFEISVDEQRCVLQPSVPEQEGAYFVLLDGEPCVEEHNIEQGKEVRLSINHNFLLTLSFTDDVLTLSLDGYLLGHQSNPSLPISFENKKKIGSIYLEGMQEKMFTLSPTVLLPVLASSDSSVLKQKLTSQGLELSLAHASKIGDVSPFFFPPSGTDRCLWFDYQSNETAFVAYSGASKDMGSDEDEGSSFAFAPFFQSNQEASKPTTTSLFVGFSKQVMEEGTFYGFVGGNLDIQVELSIEEETVIFQSNPSEHHQAGLFRDGDILQVQPGDRLRDGDLLRVGVAGFEVSISKSGVSILRKWLWLTSGEDIRLGGLEKLSTIEQSFFLPELKELEILCLARQRAHKVEDEAIEKNATIELF